MAHRQPKLAYDATLTLTTVDREIDPIEGGSANDYDYVGGRPGKRVRRCRNHLLVVRWSPRSERGDESREVRVEIQG
jgi:hypothetical protein